MNIQKINKINNNIINQLPQLIQFDVDYSKKTYTSKENYNVLEKLKDGFHTINGVDFYRNYNYDMADLGGHYEWIEIFTSSEEDMKTMLEWLGYKGNVSYDYVTVLPID